MGLLQKVEQSVLYLTLDRPTRANSLDPPTIVELRKAFLEAQSDSKIRVIVLTGSGERNFTTGIDITAAASLGTQAITNIGNTAGDIATLIYQGKPTIIAINGRAMGMGGLFAAAADYRLMHIQAHIRMPEIDIPVFPGGTAMAIFTRVCGIAWTKRIFMLGEPLGPDDALQANLANEIVSTHEKLQQRTKEIAEKMAEKNTAIIKGIKLAAPNALDLKFMDVLNLESKLSNFFEWESEDKVLSDLANKFEIRYQLTGDPEQLMKDYQKTVGKTSE